MYTLPCHRQCLNKPKDRAKERLYAKEINFISAKAMQKQIQRRSSEDRVFLGLIRKVDEGTEEEVYGGPSDVEKLRRPDLPLNNLGGLGIIIRCIHVRVAKGCTTGKYGS